MKNRPTASQEQVGGTVPERPRYPIESVDNALRLLLLLSGRSEIRIADASRELGIGRSTAHRLMQMLEFYGFAAQNPQTYAYGPGPVLANAGLQLVGEVDVREVSRPHVEVLVGRVQETVHLHSLRRDGRVACLDSIEGSQALRVGSRTGQVLPAHATAGGLALLSALPDEIVVSLLPDAQLETFTPTTAADRDSLLRELAAVRERGYGVSHGGYERDISGVGVVVPDPMGRMRLAVAVAVPSSRFDDERVRVIAEAATECAARITAALTG